MVVNHRIILLLFYLTHLLSPYPPWNSFLKLLCYCNRVSPPNFSHYHLKFKLHLLLRTKIDSVFFQYKFLPSIDTFQRFIGLVTERKILVVKIRKKQGLFLTGFSLFVFLIKGVIFLFTFPRF